MIVFYHLRIRKNGEKDYKFQYDLDEQKINIISEKYNNNQDFTIGGLRVKKDNICEILILKTNFDVESWLHNEWDKIPPEFLIFPKKENLFNSIGNEIVDVTDDILMHVNITTNANMNNLGSNKIFVVHGKNIEIRNKVTSFLKSANYEPIVAVDEKANGRTIIEQIEELTEVKKGIVIYTPDDVARPRKRYGGKPDQMFYRARQNVIFEHGYLCGKLGRRNVIMIICYDKKKEFDIPSDVNSIVYIKYNDDGEWKDQVLKEISN